MKWIYINTVHKRTTVNSAWSTSSCITYADIAFSSLRVYSWPLRRISPSKLIWRWSSRSDKTDRRVVFPLPDPPIIAQNPPKWQIYPSLLREQIFWPVTVPLMLLRRVLGGAFLVDTTMAFHVRTTGELSRMIGPKDSSLTLTLSQ
jgi:hypothetical protein